MREAASESAASLVSHNAADPVELNDVCRTKLKLPYQTDSDAALFSAELNSSIRFGTSMERRLDQA